MTEETPRVLAKRRLQTLRELALSSAFARTVPLACELALDTLLQHPHDVPFAAIYLFQADGARADRYAHTGIAADALPMFVLSGALDPQPRPDGEGRAETRGATRSWVLDKARRQRALELGLTLDQLEALDRPASPDGASPPEPR